MYVEVIECDGDLSAVPLPAKPLIRRSRSEDDLPTGGSGGATNGAEWTAGEAGGDGNGGGPTFQVPDCGLLGDDPDCWSQGDDEILQVSDGATGGGGTWSASSPHYLD